MVTFRFLFGDNLQVYNTMQNSHLNKIISLLFIPLAVSACTEHEHHAQPGDHLTVDYTCRLANGNLVETTSAIVAGDSTQVPSTIFSLRDEYRSLNFKVPQKSETYPILPFDPLEQKIGVAIANQSENLPLDTTTTLHLYNQPINNFQPKERFLEMAVRFSLPRAREISLGTLETAYGLSQQRLTIGQTVGGETSFPATIKAINNDLVTISLSAKEGATIPVPTGNATIRAKDDDTFEATVNVQKEQLVPRIGGLPGRVTHVDGNKFVIDFGQSFAGENLFCDVHVRRSLPDQLHNQTPLHWYDDINQGLKRARQQGKLAVLFLYSDACPTCEVMQHTIFPDEALESIRNQFIWIRINPTLHPEFANRFSRLTSPTTMVVDGLGNEIERISGPQHVAKLAYKFDQILTKNRK